MSEKDKPVDVAVFFDYENIVFSVRNNFNVNANFEDLMDKCKEFGRVVVAHAFADWNRQSSAMIPALISNGFDPVYVPSFLMGSDGQQSVRKNAVDMYMAIDAMDVLHNRRNVDTFILLTGDSDFLPLVNAIRRSGNRVIAIGVDGSSSSHLAQSVDDFIFYSQVSPLPNTQPQKRLKEPYEALAEAIRQLHTEGRSTVLPNVKLMMAELMGGFDEKKLADSKGRRFQKFKDFVQEAEKRGVARLVTTGTVNEVFLADDYHSEAYLKSRAASTPKPVNGETAVSKPAPVAKESKEKERGTAVVVVPPAPAPATPTRPQPALEEAFALLAQAARKAIAEEKSNKVTSIKSIMLEIDPNFDEKGIEVDGEKKFTRFNEFIEAALAAGYIKITGRGQAKNVEPGDKAPAAVAEVEAETQVAETAVVVAEAKDETAVAAPLATVTVIAEEASAPDLNNMKKGSDYESRSLIVDSLRLFNTYPAPFLKIEAFCRQIRNERNVFLPSPKVRDLLTEATRGAGILKRVSPQGVSPAQYEFNDDSVLVAAFLGVPVTETAADAPAKKDKRKKDKQGQGKPKQEQTQPVAEVVAEVAAEVAAPAEEPKKRGRKPKVEQAPAEEPKKRGRKPKAEKAEAEEPKKRGRKPKAEQAAAEEPKKRGRKPKAEQASAKPKGKRGRPAKEQPAAPALVQPTSPEVLAATFEMMKTAVAEAQAEGKSARLTAVKARMRRMQEGFDETQLTNAEGQPFTRLIELAQAAEAAGYVTISGSGVATELNLA